MTRAQIHLVNNHLTTKLLEGSRRSTEGEQALLELLCTDSIYSIKDDFDKGIDANLWVTENLVVAEHEFGGVLYSEAIAPEGETPRAGGGSSIRSRINGWKPNHRPTVQVRIAPTSSNYQVELGFVNEVPDISAVRLLSTTTLTRKADSFGVAVRSPNVSSGGWYVASGGPNTTAQTAVSTPVSETAFAWATLLVAVNEQGETRLWVNGQYDNTVARATTMSVREGHYLWLGADRGSMMIDYIQIWQERSPL